MGEKRYRIAFNVTAAEKREIEEYCRRKKRWRRPSDLARDAVFQMMAKNRAYKKREDEGDR